MIIEPTLGSNPGSAIYQLCGSGLGINLPAFQFPFICKMKLMIVPTSKGFLRELNEMIFTNVLVHCLVIVNA